jgi:hypothetical protein
MIDYKNGKIYRLVCNTTGDQYIGSTTQSLSQRLGGHKTQYKRFLEGKTTNQISSYSILSNNNFEIILLEEFACENKNELERRERHFIETVLCVNKYKPAQTKEELQKQKQTYWQEHKEELNKKMQTYYQEHKEEKQKYQQKYQQEHKEELNKKMQTYYQEHKEELQKYKQAYRQEHKEELQKKKQAYYQGHKEEIQKYKQAYRQKLKEHKLKETEEKN